MSPVQPPPGFVLQDPEQTLGRAIVGALLGVPFVMIFLTLFFGFKPAVTIIIIAGLVLLVLARDSLQAVFGWLQPQLQVMTEAYPLGSSPTVVYRRQPRRVIDISTCDIEARLFCREHVTYRQGTDTRTDTRIVYERDCSGQGQGTNEGLVAELDLVIDAHSGAPSFELPNNRVTWYVEVRARGPRLPKDKHTFVVGVSPILDQRLRPGLQDS